MRAVIPTVPPGLLAWRKQTGADRWDEMWEGVLHMAPSPNREHQDLEGAIEAYLRTHWTPIRGTHVYHNINVASVGAWPHDYRIPDLILLTSSRRGADRNEYFEGAPDVVVEIRSPGDESYEKLEFYARIGVPEVWIIDRDSKICEIHLLSEGRYALQSPRADGWTVSAATQIELMPDGRGKLAMRIGGDEATRRLLP
jgi:Uma2 family endonuclease